MYKDVLVSEKYPEIKKLFGHDTSLKWIVLMMVVVQFLMLNILKNQSWPVILLTAYCFGGVINHSLMLGKYELSLFYRSFKGKK